MTPLIIAGIALVGWVAVIGVFLTGWARFHRKLDRKETYRRNHVR